MGPKQKWAASTLIFLIAQVSEGLKGYFKLFPYSLSLKLTHAHTHTPHHHQALPKSYMQYVTGPSYASTPILKTEAELSRRELAFSRRDTSGEKSRGVSALKLSTVSSLAGFKTHFSLPSASILKKPRSSALHFNTCP